MNLKLISFSLCPFVQRAVLMLREKNFAFDIEFIDLRNKPEWFLELSPRGKVPILVVDDKDVLFESGAICEFLEEVVPEPPLLASTAIGRARDRAWFTFMSEEIFTNGYRLETSTSVEDRDTHHKAIVEKLQILEKAIGDREWLSGDGSRFGMVEIGASSSLFRFRKLRDKVDVMKETPRIAAWAERVCAKESVKNSVPETWDADYQMFLTAVGSVLA